MRECRDSVCTNLSVLSRFVLICFDWCTIPPWQEAQSRLSRGCFASTDDSAMTTAHVSPIASLSDRQGCQSVTCCQTHLIELTIKYAPCLTMNQASVTLRASVPVCGCVCLYVCVSESFRLSVCPSVCLSVYLSVCLSVFLSVRLSVRLSRSVFLTEHRPLLLVRSHEKKFNR